MRLWLVHSYSFQPFCAPSGAFQSWHAQLFFRSVLSGDVGLFTWNPHQPWGTVTEIMAGEMLHHLSLSSPGPFSLPVAELLGFSFVIR